MALTNYKYKEGDSVFHAISEGYKNPADNHWKITGAAGGFGEHISNNKWKTLAVVSVVVAVPLVAAYLLSPAYASFVDTTAASTYAGMIAGGKGLYALAIANPVFTALLTAAIVVTVGTLIYMNHSKASQIKEQANQIDGVKKAVLEVCEKEEDNPKIEGNKLKMAEGANKSTFLNNVAEVIGFLPKQVTAK
ncbi:MAG: hypothetical protein LJD31_01640 [Wolbachia endosymbiont of Menacanthus eurysternus]|nr:hypothetical protein [Wolbachia endosymbiont of Menacanthus eurysternus]